MFEEPSESFRSELAARGYASTGALFSPQECAALLQALESEERAPRDWFKGCAVTSRTYFDIAVDWRILSRVTAVLGRDVILWGAMLVRRDPGQVHPWHADIESSSPDAKTLSVWIGLRDMGPETSLKVAPGSHQFGVTAQEKAWQKGKRREEVTDADIEEWAAEYHHSVASRLAVMKDGEALFFDGRLWHGSINSSSHLNRVALLLQYADAATPIRMPVLGHVAWPFEFVDRPWPPCLLVRGNVRSGVNRITLPPLLPGADETVRLEGGVHEVSFPRDEAGTGGWRSVPAFRGVTASLADLSCHASEIEPGFYPHLPHQHPEEEILLVLSGELELFLPDLGDRPVDTRRRLQPGELAYFPAGFWHTLTAVGSGRARYLMVKWFSNPAGDGPPLSHGVFRASSSSDAGPVHPGGFRYGALFEGPTSWLARLQCHVTVLEPSAGYPPHVDDHDIIMVVLEGAVETRGRRVESPGVIFHPGGEPHGMKNPGSVAARYVVIELDGGMMASRRLQAEAAARQSAKSPEFASALVNSG